MNDPRSQRIRSAVRRNFDVSADAYHDFEERFGLFGALAERLARIAGIGEGLRVLDVGCGSGDSTLVLARMVGGGGLAVGIDMSVPMLRRVATGSGALLVQGDAQTLGCFRDARFDVAMYNACAFLLPDPEASFRAAAGLLDGGGVVGVSVFDGLFDAVSGEDLVQTYSNGHDLGVQRARIVEPASIGGMLARAVGPVVSETFVKAGPGLARQFFSIPAQAASLFARQPVPERLGLAGAFFDHLELAGHAPVLGWSLHVATSGRPAP